MHLSSLLIGAIALLAGLAAAHPGDDISHEIAERRVFLLNNKNDLSHCAERISARGHDVENMERRSALAKQLMKKRGIESRQTIPPLSKSHKSSERYTPGVSPSTIFASNHSCVLSPETTEGPYYVSGEKIRQDITENEKGVPLWVDLQVYDIQTCDPVPGIYVEIWHCNSTGVYGGVVAGGNGVSTDPSNINNTMLRGLQKTDSQYGAVQFQTVFPGHYTGRTTHIHVMVHANSTPEANGTMLDTSASHVGQTFFDQELITLVEKLTPYTSNKQPLTTNAQDGILSQELATSDPLMEYILLGNSLQDGILAWLSFGISKTASREVSAASTIYQSGGKGNPNAGMGPPGGGPGGVPGGGPPPGSRPGTPRPRPTGPPSV